MDESKRIGGLKRAESLSPARRAEIASTAAQARWAAERSPSTVWNVYALCDPGSETPFYIGCSMNLTSTKSRHKNDPASAAYRRPFELRVLSEHRDKYLARREEGRLIDTLPDLVNRQPSHGMQYEYDPTLHSLRLPQALWDFIDGRAKIRGITRNAWIVRMVEMVRDGKLKEPEAAPVPRVKSRLKGEWKAP